ncbi:hypothetical protein NSS70_11445 [Aeribacillus sp. FSL K6-2848]|uniref:hypothetical protein n=1 Tax=unclassified Aeribacillus TaxID=2640495 RepID=UPI0030D52CC9
MKFNQYLENTKNYLTAYYQDLLEQFQSRSVNSYPQLIKLEKAGINRFFQSQLDTILLNIRDELKNFFESEEASQIYNELKTKFFHKEISAMDYNFSSDSKKESLVQRVVLHSNSQNRTLKENSNQNIMYATAGGAVAGGVTGLALGTAIGKPAILAITGVIGGAVCVYFVASSFVNNYASGKERTNIKYVNKQSEISMTSKQQKDNTLPIEAVLQKRKYEVEEYIYNVITSIQKEYEAILKRAS